mmetsp:Transcript_100916/g.175178  ORF Transcript_100916/g.175178 Transcript_100916/m.175178 type:complete len:175 (-) Transcript_100916:352-876(-)
MKSAALVAVVLGIAVTLQACGGGSSTGGGGGGGGTGDTTVTTTTTTTVKQEVSDAEFCNDVLKKCATPIAESCADMNQTCSSPDFPICDPVTKLCVRQGADCTPPAACESGHYCIPKVNKCAEPTYMSCAEDSTVCDSSDQPFCCPVTKLCVKLGANCTSPCMTSGSLAEEVLA